MDCIIREVTALELQPKYSYMNREDNFCLNKAWKPLIWSLIDHRKLPQLVL
jgi:hypothetical protein